MPADKCVDGFTWNCAQIHQSNIIEVSFVSSESTRNWNGLLMAYI